MGGACVSAHGVCSMRIYPVIQIQTVPDDSNQDPYESNPNNQLLSIGSKSRHGLKWTSSLNLAGPIDKSQFKIPITEREVFTVMRSWRTIKDSMQEVGIDTFTKMFNDSPDVRQTFEKFRTFDSVSDIRDSNVLYTHGLVVMNAMDEIFNNLDDKEYLIDLILEQGSTHARFSDLNEQVFWAIKEPFLYAAGKAFDKNLNPHLETMYRKITHFILGVLAHGFQHTRKEMAMATIYRQKQQRLVDG